jgi:multidrug efflux pump subunit AcrA (membrane-fusion protein)
MKMKLCVPVLMLAGAVFFCGCNEHKDEARESEAESAGLQLFEKNKGLRLPDEMQRSLGVETLEVTDRPMARRIEKPAQVYRGASELQPAAAIVWLNAADVAHLNVGQTVSLKAASGEAFAGTLARLDQRLTNLLGQSEAVIEFPDSQHRASVGSLLTAIFTGTKTNTVTAIPASAIVHGVENSFVYTVSGSHYVRTPVKPGSDSDGWVEIVDGLYAGDVVVARAVDALWTIELCALKGGTPCCPVSKKPGRGGD